VTARVTPASAMRAVGRMTLAALALGVLGLCGVQFEHIIAKNLALSSDLSTSQADADALRRKIRRQHLAIVRLNDPHGAIQDIHEQLQLVGPNEELIYVRGTSATEPPDHF
jgi:hypothetical protein